MWSYSQSTGQLSRDGVYVATGYSGFEQGRNNPAMESEKGIGPLPRGLYDIGGPFDSEYHGPFTLTLTPDPANEMFDRGGFLCHGDSKEHPGLASHGCMIMALPVRQQLAATPRERLQVTE